MLKESTTIDQYMKDNNIRIEYESIPSREDWGNDDAYHYNVTLFKKDIKVLTTQYSVRVGHMLGYTMELNRMGYFRKLVKEMLEKGLEPENEKAFKRHYSNQVISRELFLKNHTKKHELKIADILYSLVMDSVCITCGSFEDWCENYGYETDSIKASETYKACLQIGLKMNAYFNLPELQELFQDY